jgi:hypothetical protein
MSIENRLKKVETNNAQIFDGWIKGLSDEELERIIGKRGDGRFAEWLKTLTDDELEIIRYDKPGANALKGKFDEYKKQNQKNRSG